MDIDMQSFAFQKPEISRLITPDSPKQAHEFKGWESPAIRLTCTRCFRVRQCTAKKAAILCDDCRSCKRCEIRRSGRVANGLSKICKLCDKAEKARKAGECLAETHPALAARLVVNNWRHGAHVLNQYDFRPFYPRCDKCGCAEKMIVRDVIRLGAAARCKSCLEKFRWRSLPEAQVGRFIESRGYSIETSVRSLIRSSSDTAWELDIVVRRAKVAVEVNGEYWHSEALMNQRGLTAAQYHQSKIDKCSALGIRLIYVWEADWMRSPTVVKDAVMAVLAGGEVPPLLRRLVSELDM